MATDKLNKAFKKTESALTNTIAGMTYNMNRVTKLELPGVTLVHVELAMATGSTISTGASVGKMPSGFFPTTGKNLPAVAVVSNGTTYATIVSITSSGDVSQSVSSSTQRIFVDGWFTME